MKKIVFLFLIGFVTNIVSAVSAPSITPAYVEGISTNSSSYPWNPVFGVPGIMMLSVKGKGWYADPSPRNNHFIIQFLPNSTYELEISNYNAITDWCTLDFTSQNGQLFVTVKTMPGSPIVCSFSGDPNVLNSLIL